MIPLANLRAAGLLSMGADATGSRLLHGAQRSPALLHDLDIAKAGRLVLVSQQVVDAISTRG